MDAELLYEPAGSNEANNADTTSRHELLNAPNRYADSIQGELVRLGQVNRARYSYDYGPASYSSSIYSHSAEQQSNATAASTSISMHVSPYVPPPPQLRSLPGIPSHHAYPTNTICSSHSTPYTQPVHPGQSDSFSPQLPYSMPPIADTTALWHNQTPLRQEQSHLPTPVEDAQNIGYAAHNMHDDDRQSSHSRDMSLSDGELIDNNDYGYMSEGEIRPSQDQPEDRDVDVAAIVKGRIADMLKLRDPKLLQSPELRALMLLAKCIKLEDPDEIFTHIKNASVPIASELNTLAQEFSLNMIADACANAVLAATSDTATLPEEAAGQPDLEASKQESSNEVDMDTSSDAELEQALPQPTGPDELNAVSTELRDDSQPNSRQGTASQSDFSRSRAPSPPNTTHLRADRPCVPEVQQLSLQATSEASITVCSSELVGISLASDAGDSPQAIACSLDQPPVDISVTIPRVKSDVVCAHENDRFVVYVDDSLSSSESESDMDVDENAGSSSVSSIANSRTTPSASLPISRIQSFASIPNTDSAVSSSSNYATPSADSSSNGRLNKTKQDLMAHEAEIARLKLQIKQRQTKALLIQKMQQSKRQQQQQQQPKPLVQTPTAAADSAANDSQAASVTKELTPDTPASATVQSPLPASEAGSNTFNSAKIPSLDYTKRSLSQVPSDIRDRHISTIATHLDNAIELKRMALGLTKRSSSNPSAKIYTQSFAQASERLAARQQRLQAEQNKLQQLMQRLNAAVKLVEAEQRFLDYSSSANNELQDIVNAGDSTQSLQDLESEIQAIVQLKEETASLRQPGESTASAADTDDLLRMVVDDGALPLRSQEKSAAAVQPVLSTRISAETGNVTSPEDPTTSKPGVAEMRAKMAAMREEQSTISQRLYSLVEKRKQEAAAGSTMPVQKANKKAKTAGAAGKPKKDSPNSVYTSLWLVQKTIKQAIEDHTGPYLSWCMSMTNELDSCVLQPLVAVGNVGFPRLASMDLPDCGVGGLTTKQQQQQPAGAVVKSAAAPALDREPEDALVKNSSALYITDKTASAVDSSVDLSKLTSKHLLAAISEAPKNGYGEMQSYYRDIQCALAEFSGSGEYTFVSNDSLAHALLPVWNSYKHHFTNTKIFKSNPLYGLLDLANVPPLPPFDVNHLTRKERTHVLRLAKSDETTLPILNRDFLYFPAQSESRQDEASFAKKPAARYFDSAVEDKSDGGNDKCDSEEDALYNEALQIFRKGLPSFKRPTMVNDLTMYLGVRINKDLGKAVLKLRKAVEQYPKSEKLWDMYLELYTRQRASEKDVVSTFSDATKFNPHSICIWRRYIVWCSFNASQTRTYTQTSWIDRLRMVTSMAIKFLASAQQTTRTQERSAAIAEFLLVFWERLYTTYSAGQGQSSNPATLLPVLQAHMFACLSATSVQALSDEIANVDMTATVEQPSAMYNSKWKNGQWALAGLLLPHHLLLVGLVFTSSLITEEFTPQKVLDKLLTVLYVAPSSSAMVYIDWRKVVQSKHHLADKPAEGEPHVLSVVVKFYTEMRRLLTRFKWRPEDDPLYTESYRQSIDLFKASIYATFSQLLRYETKEVKHMKFLPEDLQWDFESALSADDIRQLHFKTTTYGTSLLFSFKACANGFSGDSSKVAAVVESLWRHVFRVARDANIDVSSMRSAEDALDPCSQNTDTELQLIETRTLYYRLVGYTSGWSPTSLQRLEQIMSPSNCSPQPSDKQSSDLPTDASTWINIALVELLHVTIVKNQQLSSVKSTDIALAWLKYGLKRLRPENKGERAHIWALIFRVTMAQRPIMPSDIYMAHKDLVVPPITSSLENVSPCFLPINFILQPIIESNPSDSTLSAIGQYLSTTARSNSELAVRLIEYVRVNSRNQPDLKTMVREMSYLDVRDFAD
ncbi:hypothetical protein EV183_001220 [Coemansia sp. RSA 2336]|nr:hypothetical protein EV183_001220 [Coemansia sp. RSA 2336]